MVSGLIGSKEVGADKGVGWYVGGLDLVDIRQPGNGI